MGLWCGWGAFRRLKVILKGLHFVTRVTGVIPVDALIKNSSRTCGQTIKSNEFLHIPLELAQIFDQNWPLTPDWGRIFATHLPLGPNGDF